jgi:hypothetical protein
LDFGLPKQTDFGFWILDFGITKGEVDGCLFARDARSVILAEKATAISVHASGMG